MSRLGTIPCVSRRVGLVFCALAIPLSAASAQDTVTYSYDALGRLTTASHTGAVNNGMTQTYTHDNADNRASVTVTGAPNASGQVAPVIVVPLKGLTIIPLTRGN